MKKGTNIIVIIGALMAFGLIFWQVWHLNENQKLKFDLDKKEMSSTLLASAIEFRKVEIKHTSLSQNTSLSVKVWDSILNKNLSDYNINFKWSLFDGLGNPLNEFSSKAEFKDRLTFKVCISCLITIDILDEDGSADNDRGFVLNQTPAQMVEMKGINEVDLDYIHLFVEPQKFSFKPYIIPSVFLLGLLATLLALVNLTKKQRKLITQKNEFVNHLSHQFQTPLSSIKLSANLLANEALVDKSELVQIIQTESNRLENHIKTVLHWVKSDADHLHITKEKVRLTDLIENSLKQMKPVFLTHNTKVNFIPSEEELVIEADINHLQLMLFNIWENAIKHNDSPLELTIRMSKEKGVIQISNADNGKGISNLTSDITFKGLGLAYVKRLMHKHSGEMLLISTEKGLTLNLNFPSNG
ncbi:MAG: sensor histidine kinase [Winogradskyella sp.]|uniref:sensor histidine kinase n=1 Tax=Winogradskyella sp. TaxID=1883156 RepID=UPI00385EE1E3